MRVVHLTTVSVSLRFLRGHVNFLKKQGAQVHVISSPDDGLKQFANTHGVTAHPVAMSRQISPVSDLVSLIRLIVRLLKIKPQIAHAHTPKAGLLGMLAAAITRVPVRMYHIHGLPLDTTAGLKRWLLLRCERLACSLAHQVYCVSPSLSQSVQDYNLCCAGKIKVLENGSIDGIDTVSRFNPDRFQQSDVLALRTELGIPATSEVIGFVGRVTKDKGIKELSQAWGNIRSRYTNARLLIVGPLEITSDKLVADWEQLISDERVQYVPQVDDVTPYMMCMDIFAFPSYREGFGLAPAEASALQKPVVATRITGCVDVIEDEITGLLVAPEDADALQNGIEYYLANPAARAKHGQAGREKVARQFIPERVWAAQLQSYRYWLSGMTDQEMNLGDPIQAERQAA